MEEKLLTAEFLRKLDALRLWARRTHRSRARGEHPTTTRGMSLEFTDYRKYNPGDDFRYIDWNAFSRLERLFLKVFTAEEDIIVYLLIDASDSMGVGRPSKLDYAAQLALALAYVGINNHERVGATSFSRGLEESIPPVRGRHGISHLFDFFSALRCEGGTDFNAAMAQFASRNGRPGLVFIISDMMDQKGCSPGLEQLRYSRNDVVVVHLLAEEDVNPEPTGPLLLVDSETAQRKKLLADRQLLNGYRHCFNKFVEGVERHCLKRGMEYYRATTSLPLEELVLRYLRQGRHLH